MHTPGPQLVRDVIVGLAHEESELILLSVTLTQPQQQHCTALLTPTPTQVYALRNLENTDQITLVEALCDAKRRGVAVAVIT